MPRKSKPEPPDVAHRNYGRRMRTRCDALAELEREREAAELEQIGADLRRRTADVRPVFR